MAEKTVINFDEPEFVEQTARKEESPPAVQGGKDKAAEDRPAAQGGKDKAAEDKPAAQGGKDKAAEDKPAAQSGKDKAAEDKPAAQGGKDKTAEDKPAAQGGKDKTTEDKPTAENSKEVDSLMIDMDIPMEEEKIIVVQPEDIDKLIDDFANHPFSLGTKEQQKAFAEDIAQNGVLQAAYVRPHPTDKGRYEMLAGHRRKNGAIAANKPLPIIVRNYNDAQAITLMVSTNFKNRASIPIYEQAKAFKMEYDAMTRQGQRTNGQNVQKSNGTNGDNRTIVVLAEQYSRHNEKINYKKMQRIIKLADLVPEIGKMADTMKFGAAYDIACVDKKTQKIVYTLMKEDLRKISTKQSAEIKATYTRDKKSLDKERVAEILSSQDMKIDPVKLSPAEIQKYFPAQSTPNEMQGYILRLLERDYLMRKTKDRDYTPNIDMFKSNHVAEKIQKTNVQAKSQVEPLARGYDKTAPAAEPPKNNVVDISTAAQVKKAAPQTPPPAQDAIKLKTLDIDLNKGTVKEDSYTVDTAKQDKPQADPPATSGQSVQKSEAKPGASEKSGTKQGKKPIPPTPKPKKKR